MKRLVVIFLMLFAASVVQAAITDNLVLYMPYDEGAGVITRDLSGNGFDGKLFTQSNNQVAKWAQPVNDSIWTLGKWGYAIRFYKGTYNRNDAVGTIDKPTVDCHILGKGVYVENSSGAPHSAQKWSYSFWVRRPTDRAITNASSWVNAWDVQDWKALTSDETCIDLWDGGELRYDQLHTRYSMNGSGSGRYLWTGFSAGGSQEEDNIGFALGTGPNGNNEWVNIIMLVEGYVGADNMLLSVYVNGVLASKTTSSNGGWGYLPTEVFMVGSTTLKGIDQQDDIDDVGVWNRLLTPDEIAWLQTNPIKPTGPVLLSPEVGAVVVLPPNSTLTWQTGLFDSYDVYLGTSFDDVSTANNFFCNNLDGDVNGDCKVNVNDLELISDCWMSNSSCNPNADLWVNPANPIIDINDLAVMASEWTLAGSLSPSYKGNQTATSYTLTGLPVGTYYWRVDGIKNGQASSSVIRSFRIAPVWKQAKYVNMMGWAEMMQLDPTLRAGYAADLKALGIRHGMDNSAALGYYNAVGNEVFLYHNPTGGEYATAYRNTAGNAGYFQYDEPSSSTFAGVVKTNHDACRLADPSRPSYTNLLSSQGIGGASGTGYLTYINSFISATNPQLLSFDCYPVRYGWQHHYWSLDVCRTRTLQLGIPLWNWQQTIQKTSSTNPSTSALNQARLRGCLYTSLAYGVKGVSWFDITKVYTFGTQGYGSRTWARATSPSWVWSDLATVNAEINRVGDIMIDFTSQNVYHTLATSGTTLPLLPAGFWIQIVNSNSGFVLGTFKDPQGVDYAMVANKENSAGTAIANKQVSFNNTAVSAVYILNETNGTWSALTLQGTSPNQYITIPSLGSGYGKLLKIVKP